MNMSPSLEVLPSYALQITPECPAGELQPFPQNCRQNEGEESTPLVLADLEQSCPGGQEGGCDVVVSGVLEKKRDLVVGRAERGPRGDLTAVEKEWLEDDGQVLGMEVSGRGLEGVGRLLEVVGDISELETSLTRLGA